MPTTTPCLVQSSLDSPVVAAEVQSPLAVKVMHVINGEHYAGAERVQDLLALSLPRQGFEASFACVKPDRFDRLRQAIGAPLFNVSMRSRLDLTPARRLAAMIREQHYGLVHTHTPRSAFIGRLAAAWAGVPVVHHLHSPTTADSTHRLRNYLNAATERLSLAGVDAVIAVSHSLARYAGRIGIAAEKVFVVPNGVPILGPLPPRSPPSGGWTLGMVALFRPRKGLEVLLRAMAALKSARLPVRLRAIGSFETSQYESEIKSLAGALGVADAIEWRGFSASVNDELRQLDLFVLPSLFGEGMPMVVLEAMAAGLPVVAANVEGVPEVVRPGLEGLIVPAGDACALAAAIEQFVIGQVDWSALRIQAHRRQAERFSQHTMAAGVADVYRRALTRTQTPTRPYR